MMTLTIALDGMGGDAAPGIVVDGAASACARDPALRFVLFGDAAQLEPLVRRRGQLGPVTEIHHTAAAVAGDDRPSAALRRGRDTSMRLAIDALKDGRCAAAVSAGNTGALMAMATVVLRTLPGIHRPAICAVFPARQRPVVTLDLGANVDCGSDHLVQFAVMGATYARAILGREAPTVGLLNVGTEELKGHDTVREAATVLKQIDGHFSFQGFVEGNDVAMGTVDVIVTDGFTGNVALKVAEGTARMLMGELKKAFTSGWRGKLAYLIGQRALGPLRERFDPRHHNGAMLLGLNGVVVKSHGGTDARGFANAIAVAARFVRERANERIIEELRGAAPVLEPLAEAAG
jgi:glycerol-3-phosphate acyltransferase PlsX